MLKRLLGTDPTPGEEDGPPREAYAAKESDVRRINEDLVAEVFQGEQEWFRREDDWVAACLDELVDQDDLRLIASSLSDGASRSDLETFIDALRPVAEQWRARYEQARPGRNPDFDPAEPVEGTQYYRYARLPGTYDFDWFYASEPESADWQPLQVRYDQYEAQAVVRHTEIIEPYGDHFMKAVEGRWRFGATSDATRWYAEYEEMLKKEGLLPSDPVQLGETGEVRPHGEHFTKYLDGRWRFGVTRDATRWFAEYDELLEAQGLLPQKPVVVKEAVRRFEDARAGLDQRAFTPDAQLSSLEAAEILASAEGQVFFQEVSQELLVEQAERIDGLLDAAGEFGAEELNRLLGQFQLDQK
jgi:hypothetical protein